MRDLKAFLIEIGFEVSEGVQITEENGEILALRPCGKHAPQPFRCKRQQLPLAIWKQRPHKAKAVATLVILTDGTALYRRGGINDEVLEHFDEHEVNVVTHVRAIGEAGYVD